MAIYKITAEMNLKTLIAEAKEVAQAMNDFAENLEQIKNKYADKEEVMETQLDDFDRSGEEWR